MLNIVHYEFTATTYIKNKKEHYTEHLEIIRPIREEFLKELENGNIWADNGTNKITNDDFLMNIRDVKILGVIPIEDINLLDFDKINEEIKRSYNIGYETNNESLIQKINYKELFDKIKNELYDIISVYANFERIPYDGDFEYYNGLYYNPRTQSYIFTTDLYRYEKNKQKPHDMDKFNFDFLTKIINYLLSKCKDDENEEEEMNEKNEEEEMNEKNRTQNSENNQTIYRGE